MNIAGLDLSVNITRVKLVACRARRSSGCLLAVSLQAGIDQANEKLARVEQIKKFAVLPTTWEPGGDELTPTMKLKRKPIAAKYDSQIAGMY